MVSSVQAELQTAFAQTWYQMNLLDWFAVPKHIEKNASHMFSEWKLM